MMVPRPTYRKGIPMKAVCRWGFEIIVGEPAMLEEQTEEQSAVNGDGYTRFKGHGQA